LAPLIGGPTDEIAYVARDVVLRYKSVVTRLRSSFAHPVRSLWIALARTLVINDIWDRQK
jgi:hypothetical protein